ncbi:MAG TPA: DUF6365 family protein [Acidobacteriota bacterium]|nr:DUF6365 family protein [Acidobacteriota bacterium]
MKHLILALCTRGWGETVLGIRMAHELRRIGHECVFLTHEGAGPLFANLSFPVMKMGDHATMSEFLTIALRLFFDQCKPDSIILADYYTTDLAFDKSKTSPQFLKEFQVPLGAIDTWDLKRCGPHMDTMFDVTRKIPDWSDLLDYRLTPVPIAPVEAGPGGSPYCCLPPAPRQRVMKKVSRHVRRSLGVGDEERMVLFLTASWQHSQFTSENCNRIKRWLPELLSQYLSKLGSNVHLVHVGPAALPLEMNGQYRWVPSCAPDTFNALLSGADLLLGFNVSASTIAKAMVYGLPCMLLINSHLVKGTDDLSQAIGGGVSSEMKAWLKKAAPVHPYYMWPVGFFEFIAPLLENNEYCDAIPSFEVLDEERVLEELDKMLFNATAREEQVDRQFHYVERLRQLPSAATLVADHVQ